jgi:NADPH2:quinone reductase
MPSAIQSPRTGGTAVMTMRAFAVEHFGDAPEVRDLPIPETADAYVIRVRYAGVNPIDYKNLDHLAQTSQFPYVVGFDFAGVVERVPTDERDFAVGDRVCGLARSHGSYAEYTAVAPRVMIEPLARIPEGVTDEQAAALPMPGTIALGSLELLGVTTGQRLVVFGAAGGVGGYAVQIARSRGAHVIAIVRGGEVDEARRLGAEEIYDSSAVDVINAMHGAHPDGVDAVFDLVNGPDAIHRDAEILKPGGRVVSTIYAADIEWFAARDIVAHNISSSATTDTASRSANPSSSPQALSQLLRMLAEKTITARVGLVAQLEDAGQVLDTLRHGGIHGKAVIRI